MPILRLLFALLLLFPLLVEAQQDSQQIFELSAKSSSQVYLRPSNAAYFWWDTDDAVEVELIFEDGSKMTTGSSKEFYKKIASVKFINGTNKTVQVELNVQY